MWVSIEATSFVKTFSSNLLLVFFNFTLSKELPNSLAASIYDCLDVSRYQLHVKTRRPSRSSKKKHALFFSWCQQLLSEAEVLPAICFIIKKGGITSYLELHIIPLIITLDDDWPSLLLSHQNFSSFATSNLFPSLALILSSDIQDIAFREKQKADEKARKEAAAKLKKK